MEKNKKRFGLIGNGYLASIIAGAFKDGKIPHYELTGILGTAPGKADALAEKTGTKGYFDLDMFLSRNPDIVVEAAATGAVRQHAIPVLSRGVSMMILSIGALADENFRREVEECAEENNVKVYLPSGSIGGFDVMKTITMMGKEKGDTKTRFVMRKSAESMQGTSIYRKEWEDSKEEFSAFTGTAAEAIEKMPTKANVAVAASMATVGAENMGTEVRIVPGFEVDDISVSVRSEDACSELRFVSKPYAIAAWSVVSALENMASPLVFI